MEERYKDIEKLIKDIGIEHPSSDFVNNVMSQVQVSAIEKPIVFKPLISKKIWFVLACIFTMVLSSVLLLDGEGESVLDTINLPIFKLEGFNNPLSGFTLHKTTTYGFIFLALLFFVQVMMLKRRIDKSFSL